MVRKAKRKRLSALSRKPLAVPTRCNERWSMDFMLDSCGEGRPLRVFNVVDDWSRECLASDADRRYSGRRLAATLDRIAVLRGLPDRIVTDNGTELTSLALERWRRAGESNCTSYVRASRSRTLSSRASMASFERSVSTSTGLRAWSTPRSYSSPGATSTTESDRTAVWAISRRASLRLSGRLRLPTSRKPKESREDNQPSRVLLNSWRRTGNQVKGAILETSRNR